MLGPAAAAEVERGQALTARVGALRAQVAERLLERNGDRGLDGVARDRVAARVHWKKNGG